MQAYSEESAQARVTLSLRELLMRQNDPDRDRMNMYS